MKKVLLTGASGFIGRHCPPLLQRMGYEVHAVRHPEVPAFGEASLHWHEGNLLEERVCESLIAEIQPSHLLHLAWYAVPGNFWNAPENFQWVRASLGLLQAFAAHGGQRAVVAGSCAEYDWQYGYCTERVTPLRPHTVYGTCKHSLRLLTEALAGTTALRTAWGRLFFLYGPHEDANRLVASVIQSLLENREAPCSHGNQVRDFLYVKDVAGAFCALLDSNTEGAVNIASGDPLRLRDLVGRIGDMLGKPELIRLGALPARPDDPPLLLADVSRLSGEVGWQPEYSLNEALEETIGWWKQALKG